MDPFLLEKISRAIARTRLRLAVDLPALSDRLYDTLTRRTRLTPSGGAGGLERRLVREGVVTARVTALRSAEIAWGALIGWRAGPLEEGLILLLAPARGGFPTLVMELTVDRRRLWGFIDLLGEGGAPWPEGVDPRKGGELRFAPAGEVAPWREALSRGLGLGLDVGVEEIEPVSEAALAYLGAWLREADPTGGEGAGSSPALRSWWEGSPTARRLAAWMGPAWAREVATILAVPPPPEPPRRPLLRALEDRFMGALVAVNRVMDDGSFEANRARSGQPRPDDPPPGSPHKGIPGG